MFFYETGEIRTAVDKRGEGDEGFALSGLSGDNVYSRTGESLMTLVEIENSDWPGGMCMIFKLADGSFFVVDSGVGGRDNDGSSSGWVYASLAKHADDPDNIVVSTWLITHIHSDHAGGLPRILEYAPDLKIVCDAGELFDGVSTVSLAGHTLDSIGVIDIRTRTLISGDGLQGAGVDKYRTYTQSPEEYLRTVDRLAADEGIENVLFSHAYEPWYADRAIGREAVLACLEDCKKYVKL